MPNARVYLQKNAEKKVRTNNKGEFFISYQTENYDSLKIEHVAYEDYSIFISKKTEKRALNS